MMIASARGALACAVPTPRATPVCLSNPDTVAMHTDMVPSVLDSDSAKIVAIGLPCRGSITPVTADSVCTLAVNAFNLGADTTVTRAYVFQLGTTAYAVNGAYASAPWIYEFYSVDFTRLTGTATE